MTNESSIKTNLSRLCREKFQKAVEGKPIDLYVLKNSKGTEISVTNYGATIVAVMVPDRNGKYGNVVLGHDSIDNVIDSPEPFLGTTIGRYGNRIAQGKFSLNGQEYTLAVNNGPNALHGGPTGFHTVICDVECSDETSIMFSYVSPDGEEGYPGNLEIKMKYMLTEENELVIDYKATTDKATPVNLTNHAFFNLSGISDPTPDICNNILTVNADLYVPIDEVSIPTGEIHKVEGTPMDFRKPRKVGECIDHPFEQIAFGAGYDHTFVLNKSYFGELSYAAKCVEPVSGRILEVFTTEPGVQIYTGNWLNGFSGAHGATFPKRSAICFETQRFPDTPNKPHFPSSILKPGEEYTHTCIYKFGIE